MPDLDEPAVKVEVFPLQGINQNLRGFR